MTIHREGYKTIAIATLLYGLINLLTYYYLSAGFPFLSWLIMFLTLLLLLWIVYFFRSPKRNFILNEFAVLAPADGKVVAIEETEPGEYFNDKRIQVSIFMSPMNVHLNRNAVSGEIGYSQYHPGKNLVAWHPKSSSENEQHAVVYKMPGREIMVTQIAGFMARRIVNYLKPGMQVKQCGEMGFIKFGSRVDILLPLNTKLKVKLGDETIGGITVIAEW